MLSLTWLSECDQQEKPPSSQNVFISVQYTKQIRFNPKLIIKSDWGQLARTIGAYRGAW